MEKTLILPYLEFEYNLPLQGTATEYECTSLKEKVMVRQSKEFNNLICIVLSPKNPKKKDPLLPAVVCHIDQIEESNVMKIKLSGYSRCKIIEYSQPPITVKVELVQDVHSNIDDENRLVEKIREIITLNPSLLRVKNISQLDFLKWDNPAELSNVLISFMFGMSQKDRVKYFVEPDVFQRLLYIIEDIKKLELSSNLDILIDKKVQKAINENQKEYFLREKLRAIQEELGDKAKKDADIEELKKKINDIKMPKTTKDKLLKEVNRYQAVPSNTPESGIIKTYLDFMLSLPWDKKSTDEHDLAHAIAILDEDHYGLKKVKERIVEYLAVRILTKSNPQSILCLVGPPGVGKTSIAKSVARALNKKFIKVSLGGVKDESEIRGHRRTYIGALPGRIMQSMAKAKVNNPLFLLDEIDKMSSDYKGDPTSAMLEVLDSEQNKIFSDHYVEEPFDLSQVFFIATANYLGNIPAPLRDRMEIVEVPSYTEYEKFAIARNYLITKQLKLHGLEKEKFIISDQAIYKIIKDYTKEAGVRELERIIGSLIRKSVKMILVENLAKVEIDAFNLNDEKFLGKEKYSQTKSEQDDLVGLVNGLAYTEYGGEILPIEATMYKGDGKLVLTGKLGDVMKESAQTAYSYVKSHVDLYKIDYNVFKENDIHIHFPEGAVPKDGPSAGCAIATVLVSLATNKKVYHNIAMTGEITLRGRVLPIGGLREKSTAAHRAGIKKIFVPKENEKDLDDIPNSVKNSVEIEFITKAEDVINQVIKWS